MFLGKFKCNNYLLFAPHYNTWHFANILRVENRIESCINLAQFDPNYIFAPRGDFTHFSHTYLTLQKVIRVKHNIKGCKNLCKCGSKLPVCPKSDLFLESWLTSLLPTYWAPSSCSISNKSLELILRYEVA